MNIREDIKSKQKHRYWHSIIIFIEPKIDSKENAFSPYKNLFTLTTNYIFLKCSNYERMHKPTQDEDVSKKKRLDMFNAQCALCTLRLPSSQTSRHK